MPMMLECRKCGAKYDKDWSAGPHSCKECNAPEGPEGLVLVGRSRPKDDFYYRPSYDRDN